jgi:Tol biopolymer transport system component
VILLVCVAICGLALAVEAPSRDSRYGDTDIFLVNADGTGRRNLTRDSALQNDHPALSPDGRTLAFDRRHVDGVSSWGSVARMSARGGSVRELFGGSSDSSAYEPAWSRDGRLIAFNACCEDHAVGIMRPDGSRLRWIPDAADPMWLGSKRLAFLTDFSDAGALAIVVPKADGAERRVVVRGTDVGLMLIGSNPFASPNGRTIVFTAIDGRQNFTRVYSVNVAAGSRPRLLSGGYADASWSPTGRRLVLASSELRGLLTVRADGTRRRSFPATGRLQPQLPSWSPDGTRIAFIAYHSPSTYDLVVMNVRHRSLRVVARRVENRQPVWSWDGRRLYFVAQSGS